MGLLAAGCSLLGLACGSDAATGLAVVTLSISPDSAEVVGGQVVTMTAEVRNIFGKSFESPPPAWSSADTAIATVDANGVVHGRAEGTVEIHASVLGAKGSSRVRVLRHPRIAVSEPAVTWSVGAGGPPPGARSLSISNAGAGTLGTLTVRSGGGSTSPPWLLAEMVTDTAPTVIELSATTDELGAGVHEATLVVESDSTGVAPVEVPVRLTLTDFSLDESDGSTAVREDSGADTVLVSLSFPPPSTVVLSVSLAGTSAVASPARLEFTPADWSTHRALTIRGVDDFAVDGTELSYLTVAVDAAASDSAFHGIPPKTVRVATHDDDQAGLLVSESDQTTSVGESGTTDTLTVALAAQPLTDVVLDVSSGDPGESTADPARLTFTPADWSVPQTVEVRGVDDPDIDGNRTSMLTVSVDAQRSDAAFHGMLHSVTVTTRDDDTAGLVLEETAGATVVQEGGAADEVAVYLTARPRTDVVVEVTADEPGEATVAPSLLRFARDQWESPQLVTVSGVEDGITDGPRRSTLSFAVDPARSDDAFDTVAPLTVQMTTLDSDTMGVSPALPTGHPDVSSAALVAAYNMTTLTDQGLLEDVAGRALHGTISGTSVVASPWGGGRRFEVAADRIELPARGDFDLDGPLTLVARFRLDVPNRHQHVLACDDKFNLALREADQVRFTNTRGDLAETLSPLPIGVWHTVIGVFRGTAGDALDDTNIEIWIDGVRVPVRLRSSTDAVPPVWRDGVLHPTDACYIGFESHQGDPTHQDLAFHGAIDEILVFGRALTEGEIGVLSRYP